MPAHFGENELLGAMQDDNHVIHEDVTSIALGYRTDRKLLEQYIPEGFELVEPVVRVFAAINDGCQWLAGRSYNVVGATVPVIFKGKVDEIAGPFILVLWEDCTEAIVGGREQTGVPKVYADIDVRLTDRQWLAAGSSNGNKFIDIELDEAKKVSAEELATLNENQGVNNMLAWRYIPNIGNPGPALSHATLFPQEMGKITEAWRGKPSVQWTGLNWEQSPNQYKISTALAALPILEYQYGIATTFPAKLRIGLARELR